MKEQIETCPVERAELLVEYIINEKFVEVVASKNKGLIMKAVMPELKGKTDGKAISEVVNKLCQ